jgi:hypothetical protein
MRSKMTILSVDWDYFFPDPSWWDWGHSEAPIYYEMLWDLRPGNTNLLTKEVAIDVYHPNPALLDGFWDRTLDETPWLAQLWLVESHKTMHDAMAKLSKIFALDIWNFDQHHDLYGPDNVTEVNCGNWAKPFTKGRTHHYHVIYPPWRKEYPDTEFKGRCDVWYEHPGKLSPDIIFVCRSSCWTPPWSDDKWLEFIGEVKDKYKGCMLRTVPFVMNARKLNLKAAKEQAKNYLREMEALRDHRRSGKTGSDQEGIVGGGTDQSADGDRRESVSRKMESCAESTTLVR